MAGGKKRQRGTIDAEWARNVRISGRLVVIFTRQLASMLKNAVPISQALDTLSHQPESTNFGELIRQVGEKLETGVNFSRCLSYFPRVFSPIFITMVQIGEQTGTLDDTMERLSGWLERDEALRQRLKGALSYPAFVFVLSVGMTLLLFYTIMPGFISIFRDMKIELPAITRLVVWITDTLRNPGAILMGLAGAGLGLKAFTAWTSKPQGARHFYLMCLRIPLVGSMLAFGSLARYCASMEALLATGTDLAKALRLSATASGSPLLAGDAQAAVESVMQGEPLSDHMRSRDEIYPLTLTNFVSSGEETSALSEMYGRTAVYYDMEMNYKVEALGAALEPLMLFGVSSLVGTIVLSIFLPMYSYIGNLGQ